MAIYNKSYVWTTLSDHVNRSDQEIYSLCGVNLVFLDETTYGIIKNIRVPNLDEVQQPIPTTVVGHKNLLRKPAGEVDVAEHLKNRNEAKTGNKAENFERIPSGHIWYSTAACSI